MDDIIFGVLKYKAHKDFLSLKAKGNSMWPRIKDGDSVIVREKTEYDIGDIIVFKYNKADLIMHRVVKKVHGGYWCKGDNSFRIENIKIDSIIGGVIKINENAMETETSEITKASLQIGLLYIRSNYSVETIVNRIEYIDYRKNFIDI